MRASGGWRLGSRTLWNELTLRFFVRLTYKSDGHIEFTGLHCEKKKMKATMKNQMLLWLMKIMTMLKDSNVCAMMVNLNLWLQEIMEGLKND